MKHSATTTCLTALAVAVGCLLTNARQVDARAPQGIVARPHNSAAHQQPASAETSVAPTVEGAGYTPHQGMPASDISHFQFANLHSPRHTHPDDPHRHRGIGQPLEGTSWRNRPIHVGWFTGGLFGDTLVNGEVVQNNDVLNGYRIGWDFDHYRSLEVRFQHADLPTRTVQGERGESRHRYFDINYLFYPLGDAAARPYVSIGVGWATFGFTDNSGTDVKNTAFHFPVAIGIKYQWKSWLAVRTEFVDNIAFGSDDINSMHNLQLSLGVEFHFGRQPRSYYPYLH